MEEETKRRKRTDAKRASERRYQLEKTRLIALKFYQADMDLFNYLESIVPKNDRQKYIKKLLREDMERRLENNGN